MNTSPPPPPPDPHTLLPRSLMCCNVDALKQQLKNFLCAARMTENSELLHVFLVLAAAPQPRTLGLMRTEEGSRVPRRGRDDGPLVSVTDGRKGLTFSLPTPHPDAIASPPGSRVLHAAGKSEDVKLVSGKASDGKKKRVWFCLAQKCSNRPLRLQSSPDLWVGRVSEKHPALKNSTPGVTRKKQWKRRLLENLSKSYVRLLSGQIFVVPGWSTHRAGLFPGVP